MAESSLSLKRLSFLPSPDRPIPPLKTRLPHRSALPRTCYPVSSTRPPRNLHGSRSVVWGSSPSSFFSSNSLLASRQTLTFFPPPSSRSLFLRSDQAAFSPSSPPGESSLSEATNSSVSLEVDSKPKERFPSSRTSSDARSLPFLESRLLLRRL